MKILALEFSTQRRSVAVVIDGEPRGHAMEQGGRETHSFAMIEEAIRGAGIGRSDIECVAVGIGPGSYAGIRIAISIAQGFHVARGVKLAGVPSADGVAAQAHADGVRGSLLTVVDAQRNELFGAGYLLTAEGWKCVEPFALLPSGAAARGDAITARIDLLEHPTMRVLIPDAAMIGRLAEQRQQFVAAPELEPIYLRKAEFVKAAVPRAV
jgi:tRNA threonylcarbamoyl adenosine modification protein YeaZ